MNLKNKLLACLAILSWTEIIPRFNFDFNAKKAVSITGKAIAGCFLLKTIKITSKYLLSVDGKTYNPELYEVFEQIKNDYGIQEHINLRVWNTTLTKAILTSITCPRAGGLYVFEFSHNVFITDTNKRFGIQNSDDADYKKALTIHILAHELEHHRQALAYSGSKTIKWHAGNITNEIKMQGEQAADAASAGYQHCHHCLKLIAKNKETEYSPTENKGGCFASQTGYFVKDDYDTYIQEAEANHATCLAHKNGPNPSSDTPLKDYLPIIR